MATIQILIGPSCLQKDLWEIVVQVIVQESLADMISSKVAKVKVLGDMEIIPFVKSSGINLTIAGMVETRLAMGFTGHLAAGLGCFK
ncbi:hypothetical protein EJD97_000751 [Solanum chilense]|uniref:Uncharacterized protein n=1 Tax=Solanum chilense TaxID=4083 RepID=A0A6N2C023_SOLCI|nr:hypothetical protein EJD97_000751 [Solanum chilense]